MPQKLLRAKKQKIVQTKKSFRRPLGVTLVGTYKEKQLAWIRRNGVYNYPVKDGDQIDDKTLEMVAELWLYAGVKSVRYAFSAEYVGKMTRDEFVAAYPSYANLGKSRSKVYYVFKATPLEYGATTAGRLVLARAGDFGGRSAKVKKAIEQFKVDGEYAPLAGYLPKELASIPPQQLRVCEAAVQMEFFDLFEAAMAPREFSIEEVACREHTSVKIVRRFVASGQLQSVRRGSRYLITESAVKAFEAANCEPSQIHFVVGQGIDPELRDMRKRGKKVGAGVSRVVRKRGKISTRKDDVVNWQDISGVWNNPGVSHEMTFVDLFCGAGGLSKGLEMAGLEGICGLDWFDEAGQTYARNFDHPFINGDIKLPENKERFYATVAERLHGRQLSVVAGGFPCQGFSMAGNRIVDDPRNSLYKELIEIVERLRPEFVVCENVKGLRSMLNGAVEEKILADLRAIGYETNVTTLCAADYYTPQKRERVIFIGNRIGVRNLHPKPILTPGHYRTTKDAIEDLMQHPADPAFNHVPTHHRADMVERMRVLPEGESLYEGYSDAWKRCPWNEASCTIKENHGGVNVHPILPRVLTAREMARIQSFPDDFIFEGRKSKQLVQIGNAVPPFLGKAVGIALRFAKHDI